jgi:adenylosuccinate lyase
LATLRVSFTTLLTSSDVVDTANALLGAGRLDILLGKIDALLDGP